MKYEKIYYNSPIFFQNIMCSVAGLQNSRTRYGDTYKYYMDFYDKYDKLSFDEKIELQRQELVKFINYAYTHSKFYHQLYKDIDISKIQTVDDLKILPVVDKEMFRENYDDICTVDRRYAVESGTGGTTGKSLILHFTVEDRMQRMAQLDHCKKRVGFVSLKMKRATFSGKHIVPVNQKDNVKIFWRYNASVKQLLFSSFNITEENLKYYVEKLNKFKPDEIDGYFSSIEEVACYIERHKIKLEFKPIAIFTTSETITEEGRKKIERVFGCKVYDYYASSEGAPMIFECSHQHKHLELMTGVFEHTDDSSNELLVTSFTTHGAPIIRYKIGDCITFDSLTTASDCPCGNDAPVIKNIEGRTLDFLYKPDMAKITAVNFANLVKNMPNIIIKSQYTQDKLDEITGYYVVDKKRFDSDKHIKLIEDAFYSYFNKDETNFKIKIVDEIPRTSAGKYRLIINHVAEKTIK